jgi:Zn-dependent protease
MENKKEWLKIGLVVLIITLSLNLSLTFTEYWQKFFVTLFMVSLVIGLNILIKKIIAYRLDSEIENKVWEIRSSRLNLKKSKKIQIGMIIPFLSKLILFPLGNFIWMACIVFDVKPRVYRGAKRFGLYTFSDLTEAHIGLIAASGVILNIILAIIGYLTGLTEFSRLNLYYAFFNILPISELDGNKIFFGNKVFWSFLASLILIGLCFLVFIV